MEKVIKVNKLLKRKCVSCFRNNPRKRCVKCLHSYYCSRKCQITDWKYHKTYCGLLAEKNDEYICVHNVVEWFDYRKERYVQINGSFADLGIAKAYQIKCCVKAKETRYFKVFEEIQPSIAPFTLIRKNPKFKDRALDPEWIIAIDECEVYRFSILRAFLPRKLLLLDFRREDYHLFPRPFRMIVLAMLLCQERKRNLCDDVLNVIFDFLCSYKEYSIYKNDVDFGVFHVVGYKKGIWGGSNSVYSGHDFCFLDCENAVECENELKVRNMGKIGDKENNRTDPDEEKLDNSRKIKEGGYYEQNQFLRIPHGRICGWYYYVIKSKLNWQPPK